MMMISLKNCEILANYTCFKLFYYFLKENLSLSLLFSLNSNFELILSQLLVSQWNNHGYDVAKLFGSKFKYVSPVWLQVKRNPQGAYSVHGTHDIDKGKTVFQNNSLFRERLSV